MSAELLLFKNGEHNSESVSTLDRDLDLLNCIRGCVRFTLDSRKKQGGRE